MEPILSSDQTWTVAQVVMGAVLLCSSIMERRRMVNMGKLLRASRLAIDHAAAEEAALQKKIVSLEARGKHRLLLLFLAVFFAFAFQVNDAGGVCVVVEQSSPTHDCDPAGHQGLRPGSTTDSNGSRPLNLERACLGEECLCTSGSNRTMCQHPHAET